MSVEKQSVESTAEAVKPVDDQKANIVSDGASLESAVSDTNSKADDSNTTADGTPVENTEILPEEISASRARAWFEQLDASERATNLSFVDGPFLGAFLAFSSWSPVRSGLEGASAGMYCILRVSYVSLPLERPYVARIRHLESEDSRGWTDAIEVRLRVDLDLNFISHTSCLLASSLVSFMIFA